MKKNFLLKLSAFALTVVMLMSSMVFSASATESSAPTTSWTDSGNYDTAWYSASAASYEIDTAAELAGLAKLSLDGNTFAGKTIYITADIDLGAHAWSGIGLHNATGSSGTAFMGLIEGKKGGTEGAAVTVSNMYMNDTVNHRAAFVRQQRGGGIKNLILDNANVTGVTSGSNYGVAAVCAYVALANSNDVKSVVYENITVKNSSVTLAVKDAIGVGLVFGHFHAAAAGEVEFKNINCYDSSVDASKTTCRQIGGIVGRLTQSADIKVTDCIVADCDLVGANGRVGGMIGHSSNPNISFSNCYTSGTINAVAQNEAAAFLAFTEGTGTVRFTDCQTDAIITALASEVYAGSFIGRIKDVKVIELGACVATGISRGSNGYAWVGTVDSTSTTISAQNCYSVSNETVWGDKVPAKVTYGQLSDGLSAEKWEVRTAKTPVLKLAKSAVTEQYAAADLSWFTADATAKYTVTTEAQLYGFGLLSHVCTPSDYDIVVDSSLHSKLFEEGLLNPDFAIAYDVNGADAPKAEGIDGVRSNTENWNPTASLTLDKLKAFVTSPVIYTRTDGEYVYIFVEAAEPASNYEVATLYLLLNIDPENCTTGMQDANGKGKYVQAEFSGDGKPGYFKWNGGSYSPSETLGANSSNYAVKNENGTWALEIRFELTDAAKTALASDKYDIELDAKVVYSGGAENYCSKNNIGGFDMNGNNAVTVSLHKDPSKLVVESEDTGSINNEDNADEPTTETAAETAEEEEKGCGSNVSGIGVLFVVMCAFAIAFALKRGKKATAR